MSRSGSAHHGVVKLGGVHVASCAVTQNRAPQETQNMEIAKEGKQIQNQRAEHGEARAADCEITNSLIGVQELGVAAIACICRPGPFLYGSSIDTALPMIAY